jgi:TPP-dependent pyruvate/acetoin dehydrogenase alpha subunit
MHTCSPEHHFYSSSIVAGCVAIAAGVALALKMKGSAQKVYCFVGDAATDMGWFTEAIRYALSNDLPITYIIENNNRSVCSTIGQRWGHVEHLPTNSKVLYYEYKSEWPHCGMGEFVTF